jgi:hypothetical protein
VYSESQRLGKLGETILQMTLLEKGFMVFFPIASQGPVDLVAISPEGVTHFFDAKVDRSRVNPGRRKAHRIHRVRSRFQKELGVHVAYVDIYKKTVHFVPPLKV